MTFHFHLSIMNVMNIVRAIFYELQPCRPKDLAYFAKLFYKSVVILFSEFSLLPAFILSIDRPSRSVTVATLIWITLYGCFVFLKLGSLYFMISCFILIFSNLGDRQIGEMSAYSVFNMGYERLLGEMFQVCSYSSLS